MSAMMNFESAVYVNDQLNRLMVNAAQELAQRSIKACAEHYNFDAEEALRLLGLINVKLARNKPVVAKIPKEKVAVLKPAFPMPYNGEHAVAGCCSALRQNQGLYTQCTASVKGDKIFCKQCQANADKNDGVPEYGTIAMRQAVGIFEYVDPKGRKPVAYTRVMKKYKIDQDKVMEEAGKFNIIINAEHFVVPEADSKRGRPKAEKAPKEKGAKGRPKKAKKVLHIEGDEDDDLFASLVADANANADENAVVVAPKKKGKSDEEKEAERIAKENEKKEKEAKRAAEKAEKEAKLAAEKAEKEAKAAAEKIARELKKAKEEEEKLAKKAALELAKKEKEEKLAAEKAEKEAAKAAKSAKKPAAAPKPAEPVVEEEPDVVKKIEFEGKKYLKSKKTGIVYDYTEYVKNGEQVVVGKWNDAKNKIDFSNASEEEAEEEYEM